MNHPPLTEHPHGITTIETGYLRPGFDASHLIVENGQAAFVDTGTTHSVPLLLDALAQKGIAREAVSHVMATHVHLDHAGGAGALLQELPNAVAVVHPRGARHLINPEKLIAGTQAVYGEARFRELYGEVVPIPEERVLIAEDEFRLDFNGRPLLFLDAPGHAKHHYCVIDETARALFAGDNFGIAYRELVNENGPFLFPSTTPVQFDPEAMHQTLDRLMTHQPQVAYLTHYGRVDEPLRHVDTLHRWVDRYVQEAQAVRDEADRQSALEARLRTAMHAALREHGCTLPDPEVDHLLAVDYELNAQGLLVWLERHLASA